MVGKRKREGLGAVADPIDGCSSSGGEDLQEIFRRHFEAQFQPLPQSKSTLIAKPTTEHEQPEGDESGWEGISNDQDDIDIEIVEYTASTAAVKAALTKEELKDFMTSKPPSTSVKSSSTAKRKGADAGEQEETSVEAANLKNDLALQRLLKESHLLDSSSSLGPAGFNRHRALDLRLQALGSKSSVLAQERMPLSHRRGIVSKATEREAKRRHEAKENGIILEKAKKLKITAEVKREKGIGAPAIGKFKGGMLKLSKKDVADIEGFKGSKTGKRRG